MSVSIWSSPWNLRVSNEAHSGVHSTTELPTRMRSWGIVNVDSSNECLVKRTPGVTSTERGLGDSQRDWSLSHFGSK